MRAWLTLLFCGLLAACAPALPPSAFAPANPEFYADLSDDFYLKEKIAVGRVVNSREESRVIAAGSVKEAVHKVLKDSHLLAEHHPKYILDVNLVDYSIVGHGFFTLRAGAAVTYTLRADDEPVFTKTITATQENKRGLFEDADPVATRATATAIGETTAQLVRELILLTPADLGIAPPKTKANKK